MLNSLLSRRALQQAARRGIHTRRKMKNPYNIPQALLANLPKKKVRANENMAPPDPEQYPNSVVTSAHAIDVANGKLSVEDSAAVSPTGSVVHGTYGDLGDAAAAIPLEYLALLRPAAEGAAAVRAVGDKPGTLLVFGVSEASGMTAMQLASDAGHTVVGVVGANHAAHDNMNEYVKAMVPEPGTAVAESYALCKKAFADLVGSISSGDEGLTKYSAAECLEEFKENLLAYAETYPETMPAAVDASKLKFIGMEKDKDEFKTNMEAYLAQYPPGAPAIDKQKLEAYFNTEQYEIFRSKFWQQTTDVISGDESHHFSPPHIVDDLVKTPGSVDNYDGAGDTFPYAFSPSNGAYAAEDKVKAGGPIVGAIIVVTPTLEAAAKAIDSAKGMRAKGEALQFLTVSQKDAFRAARSVAALAQAAGAPVYTVGGSLPGLSTVEVTDADVKTAVAGMDIQDDGTTKLNYFVQVYRANDFPFYGDYAIHRASEELAGPRQIVVTK